eukprot:COSAG01_NODE_778_length_13681_cov_15.265130_10_plen_206_part_00
MCPRNGSCLNGNGSTISESMALLRISNNNILLYYSTCRRATHAPHVTVVGGGKVGGGTCGSCGWSRCEMRSCAAPKSIHESKMAWEPPYTSTHATFNSSHAFHIRFHTFPGPIISTRTRTRRCATALPCAGHAGVSRHPATSGWPPGCAPPHKQARDNRNAAPAPAASVRAGRGRCVSIFRHKNRRRIGESQSRTDVTKVNLSHE